MKRLLLPFSWMYGGVIALRNALYTQGFFDAYQAAVPVISIGNLTTGGTGKTPMAEYLIDFFQKKGMKAGYLSRGYGRKTKGYLQVQPSEGDSTIYGDEALQVARKFPKAAVSVCEDRKTGIQRLIQDRRVQCIILDDAFQHRKVKRDMDIVMVDANRPPWYDHLLPVGSLREPFKNIDRADWVVVNKLTDSAEVVSLRNKLNRVAVPIAFCRPAWQGVYDFQSATSETQFPSHAILFSGIGNNDFFFEQAEAKGIKVEKTIGFRDHHAYQQHDLDRIIADYHSFENSPNFDSLVMLTTEKDYCRMSGLAENTVLARYPFRFVRMQLEWLAGEAVFIEKLHTFLTKK